MQPYAESFYKSNAWRKCRNSFMESKHFMCERCGRRATIVHHRKHITPQNINDPSITLNWSNLMCVCLVCHNAIHGNNTGVPEGMYFDTNGNLVSKAR